MGKNLWKKRWEKKKGGGSFRILPRDQTPNKKGGGASPSRSGAKRSVEEEVLEVIDHKK